jgi:hypothetical protein
MPSALFRRRWLVAILAGALVATGGLAYAAVPDAGGVIHSCYTKSSGAWRVIDTATGQACKSNEAALDLYSKGGADALFLDQAEANGLYLGKTEKAADSDKLDGQDSSAFLGAGAKAADSDKFDGKDSAEFLGANATAADSSKLGGFAAHLYVLGGGVLITDAGNLANGQRFPYTCCSELNLTPPMTFELRCDTSGATTLVASSPGSFRWWSDGAFANATPVASGFEAEFAIGNGVERTFVRTTAGFVSTTYDLDTAIGATCNFGWTWVQTRHTTPGP